MAKKSRGGQKKSNSTPKKAVTVTEPVVTPVDVTPVEPVLEAKAPSRTTKARRAQATGDHLEDEYGYIVGDLRRVLILAIFMFGLLIVLNVVLGMLN